MTQRNASNAIFLEYKYSGIFSLFLPNYVLISEDILLYLKPLISEECGAGEIIMLENWIRPVPNHKSAVDR